MELSGATVLLLFSIIFLAVLAGVGIGLVIGIALVGRDEDAPAERGPAPNRALAQPVSPSLEGQTAPDLPSVVAPSAQGVEWGPPESRAEAQPTFAAAASFSTGAAVAADAAMHVASPAAPAQRRPQSWSIALAIGVMLVCCVCTWLVAAMATLGN